MNFVSSRDIYGFRPTVSRRPLGTFLSFGVRKVSFVTVGVRLGSRPETVFG